MRSNLQIFDMLFLLYNIILNKFLVLIPKTKKVLSLISDFPLLCCYIKERKKNQNGSKNC